MSNKGKFYMTTAIAYTSGKPHIGNTYEIVLSDCIARYKRLEGYDVYFQTGTDENGQKIELKAAEKGVTPKEFVDDIASQVKNIWDLMNSSYDNFVRTTDTDHEHQVQKIFKKLYDKGDIYKGAYEGYQTGGILGIFTGMFEAIDRFNERFRAMLPSSSLNLEIPHTEFGIEKVIFNKEKGVTVVKWKSGDVTKVHCAENDTWDEEKALALCVMKHLCHDRSYYNDYFVSRIYTGYCKFY